MLPVVYTYSSPPISTENSETWGRAVVTTNLWGRFSTSTEFVYFFGSANMFGVGACVPAPRSRKTTELIWGYPEMEAQMGGL